MGKPKADALEVIRALPDDCTWDEIRYRLSVRAQVERGLTAAAAGDVISHEDAKKQIEEWLQSSGLGPH